MTYSMAVVIALAILMTILFVTDRLRQDAVALLILVLLGVFQIVPEHQLFSGFSSGAVISLIAVMIMGKGFEKAGIVSLISIITIRASNGKRKRAFVLLSLFTGLIAAFLRSLGGFALLMPVINRLALYFGLPRSKLFMPMGFCAIVGGTITMVGSGPLLILNDLMHSANKHIEPISLFTLTPIGLILLLAIILFFSLVGVYLLPNEDQQSQKLGADSKSFRHTYGYGGKLYELKLLSDSPVKQMDMGELEDALEDLQLAVVALFDGHQTHMPALRKLRMATGCRIAILGKKEAVEAFAADYKLRVSSRLKVFADVLNPMRSGFCEVVVPPGSSLIGEPVNELHMRRSYGVQVLSIFRGTRYYHSNEMLELKVRSGDALGLYSTWQSLQRIERQNEFAVVTTEYPREKYMPHKIHHALGCFLVSLILLIISPLSVSTSLMVGALLMILFKVIELDEAYRSVSWKTVFLLAGLIPFGLAFQNSGLAMTVSNELTYWLGSFPVSLVLAVLCLLAALFSLIMTNVGAAVVLVPIAIHVAQSMGADPRTFAIVTAIATSNSFLLPTHQVNALITGAGCYQVKDFMKVGAIVSVLYILVLVAGASVLL